MLEITFFLYDARMTSEPPPNILKIWRNTGIPVSLLAALLLSIQNLIG